MQALIIDESSVVMHLHPLPIRQSTGFGFLLKTRPVARTRRLHLFIVRKSDNLPGQLGILVPKRYVKRAIDRHLLKRLIRAASTGHCFSSSADVLVRVVCPVDHIGKYERKQWTLEIEHLLQQL